MRRSLITLAILVSFPAMLYGQWTARRQLDPMTDEDRSTALVVSASGDATLAVRCSNSAAATFEILVGFDEYLGNDLEDTGLRYRVDSEPVSRWIWVNLSTDGTALFVRSEETWSLLKHLQRGSAITFEAIDYRGSHHRERYSLRGSSRAISTLGDCLKPPTGYFIGFSHPDDDLARYSRHPAEVLEVGCSGERSGPNEGLYINGPLFSGTLHIAAGADTGTLSGSRKLTGYRAQWAIRALMTGEPLLVIWKPLLGRVFTDSVVAADQHAANVEEVTRACYDDAPQEFVP